MRAVLILTLALAPGVKASEASSRPPRLLDSPAFCIGRALPHLKRPGVSRCPLRSSAVVAEAVPNVDCAAQRKNARLSKSHSSESKNRKRSEPLDVSHVIHGLELGRGLRYQSHYPSSPRAALLEKPALRGMLTKLHAAALSVIMEPESRRELEFSSTQLEKVRSEVSRTYESGEKHLTVLSHLFANHLTDGDYSCKSVVTADAAGNRFTLSQSVSAEALRSGSDSFSLADQQLRELRFDASSRHEDESWAATKMVDHFLEFEAHKNNQFGVHRIIAKARSSSDYWKLISDSLFGIDVPDHSSSHEPSTMYTIKIVVEDSDHAVALQRNLCNFYWNDKELREHGAPVDFATRRLDLLEQSGSGHRSSTFNWLDTPISVQVITLDEHYEESEMAHMKQREDRAHRRELLADQFAAESQLFRFSRELLQWIGDVSAGSPPPSCASIGVTINDC